MFPGNLKRMMIMLLVLGLPAHGGGVFKNQTAIAGQAKPQPEDEDKLRGRWKAIYAEQDGKPVNEETIYTFEQKGWVLTETPKGTYPMARRYHLNASTNPKTLDMAWSVESKGTYVLDGDTLVHRMTLEWFDENGKTVRQTHLRVLKRQ